MYLAGVPEHTQVAVPAVLFQVGLNVNVTAAPTDVAAVLPVTVTIPVVAVVAPVILPITGTKQVDAAVWGSVP